MNEALVAIESYPTLAEAHLARIHLEESGIPAFVSEQWDEMGSRLAQGYPVYVREEDVERARPLVARA